MTAAGLSNFREPRSSSRPLPPRPRFGSEPGTYVLFIAVTAATELAVGRLGTLRFEAGHHAYVGSAFGPGGLEARLRRHLRADKRRHWHIDYLLDAASVTRIWTVAGLERLECQLAGQLAATRGAGLVAGFGASDCGCSSHLVTLPRLPSRACVRRRLRATVPGVAGLRIRELTT